MTLLSIFEPDSIAVIGASNSENKWGGRILKNIIIGGFRGRVYPVNPKEEIVQGLRSYPSVLDIEDRVEAAIIAIPADRFLEILEECGQKGIRGIIAVTAGFSETGEEGRKLEKQAVDIVNRYGMRLIGPNTLGIVNERVSLNASIISQLPQQGPISFITQSGTLGLALADWTIDMGIGLSKVISVGNKANVDDVDLIEYLNEDPATGVIAMYVEGINRGRPFMDLVRKMKKPVIVMKAGRSKRGAKAVFSHTGSIAGSDDVYSAAFRQAGAIRVDAVEEIFDAALAFSCQPLPGGNRVGIISNGGGASIVAADACERNSIELAELKDGTKEQIMKVLPPFASHSNPIDTAGTSTYEAYKESVKALLRDPGVDALIVIYVHTEMNDSVPPARAVVEVKGESDRRGCPKPVISCWLGGAGVDRGIAFLKNNCMPNYPVPERAVKALSCLMQHKKFLESVRYDID